MAPHHIVYHLNVMRRDCFNIAELFKTHCCLSQKILALGPTQSLKSKRKEIFSPPLSYSSCKTSGSPHAVLTDRVLPFARNSALLSQSTTSATTFSLSLVPTSERSPCFAFLNLQSQLQRFLISDLIKHDAS